MATHPTSMKPAGVVAFTGHMMDRVGRRPPHFVPRFPAGKERPVTDGIRRTLDKLGPRFGYCSAACGGDIIFIEQMQKRGCKVHVVLPYSKEVFISDCVCVANDRPPEEHFQGREWHARFDKAIEDAESITVLGDKRPDDNAMASDCCNRVVLGLGLMETQSSAERLTLVALWDGWSGDAPGGTRSMIKLATGRGVNIEYITELQPQTVTEILQTASPPPGIGAQPARAALGQEPPQQICAILFADVMRFSDLDETKIPLFVKGYLNPLATLVQQARQGGYGPLDFNTWGDGLFCVFDSMLKAGEFALKLQQFTGSGDWRVEGNADNLKLRIALHAGPVYRVPDPIFPKEMFIGTNVNLAARMEPKTPPGEVYCSQTFAALAAVEGVRDFTCTYVNKIALPKNAGEHLIYALKPASVTGSGA